MSKSIQKITDPHTQKETEIKARMHNKANSADAKSSAAD